MTLPRAGRNALRRMFATSTEATIKKNVADNLELWPNFFSLPEQRILLATALEKLDSTESRLARRRRKSYQPPKDESARTGLQDLFYPDEYYQFQEGHYDGVIHHYREMHLNSWPEADVPGLTSVLKRLHSLCPSQNIQTHLLHLASYGEILPHVDNVSASGSWILGVSLGAERILRMEASSGAGNSFEVPLPSGSVYLQWDSMRFDYKHSILGNSAFGPVPHGQRLSIMIRDLPTTKETKL